MSQPVTYLAAFLCGGGLCLIGQLLIDKTKLTPARILVIYVVAGVVLGGLGLYRPLVELCGAGATVPLTGFGYNLARGVARGSRSGGSWASSWGASPPPRGGSPPRSSSAIWRPFSSRPSPSREAGERLPAARIEKERRSGPFRREGASTGASLFCGSDRETYSFSLTLAALPTRSRR